MLLKKEQRKAASQFGRSNKEDDIRTAPPENVTERGLTRETVMEKRGINFDLQSSHSFLSRV